MMPEILMPKMHHPAPVNAGNSGVIIIHVCGYAACISACVLHLHKATRIINTDCMILQEQEEYLSSGGPECTRMHRF